MTRHLKLSGNAELRKGDSSDLGNTNGLTLGVDLDYNRRALSVKAGWKNDFLEYRNRERKGSISAVYGVLFSGP